MKTVKHYSKYFCGNKISDCGLEHGYVDYATLAKSFDAVLVNDITKLFYNTIGGEYVEPELYNGSDYDDENDNYYDIYQYFIISRNGAEILSDYTDEIVYYIDALDMYIWGVTHFGTRWSGVLTNIKLELEENTSNEKI